VYPLGPGKIYKAPPAVKGSIPDEQTLLNEYIFKSSNSSVTPFQYFVETQYITWSFFPMLESESTLAKGYLKTVIDEPTARAAVQFSHDLAKISDDIRKREKVTSDKLPEYSVLDPKRIPYYTYI